MMIEDAELRNIFKTASEEHLQNLEAGLMHLEKNPGDRARLEEVLREAHTLKGDARMLGVRDVETLTHQLEEILSAFKRGESVLAGENCDRLYQGLDAIRLLVHEAAGGQSANVNVFYVLAQLMGADSSASNQQNLPATTKTDIHKDTLLPVSIPEAANPFNDVDALFPDSISETSNPFNDIDALFPETLLAAPKQFNDIDILPECIPETTTHFNNIDVLFPECIPQVPKTPELPARVEPVSVPASAVLKTSSAEPLPPQAPVSEEVSADYQIETIRVEPQKLDILMTQAGELTVTKNRIAHHITEIEEIFTLCEEWSRDAFVNRITLKDGEQHLQNGALKQVQNFQRRTQERLERLGVLIDHLKTTTSEDSARLDIVVNELESGIRTLRLLPLSTIFNLFPRMVRDLAKQQSKEVNLVIEGGDTKADKRILEEMKDPLMHMLRNAIDHGIETSQERQQLGKPRMATIRLRGYQNGTSIGIEITDDGRGLNIESIKRTALRRGICSEAQLAAMTTAQIQLLIFAPGFSTRTQVTEISGRGVGLDVVRAKVERLKGTIQVESFPGAGSTFRLQLNTTITTTNVLIVEANSMYYALPVEFVQTTLLVSKREIFAIEGSQTMLLDGQPVSVAPLADLLELPISVPGGAKADDTASKMLPCIILQLGNERLGLLVDALLDQQDVVLKPQSKLLGRIRNISGATILSTGEVCMILNPQDLLLTVRKRRGGMTAQKAIEQTKSKQTILLVEDSITIRTQVKRILEGAGYEVVVAVDGLDGFNKLRTQNFDAVVSDVQMPNLDGLGLAAKIRQYKEYSELPIILVTTLASDEDKRRGAEAGANAYLTKGNFDQKLLLDTLSRLV